MIRATPVLTGGDDFTVTVEIILEDLTGAGIKKITIKDNFGIEIGIGDSAQPQDCPLTHIITVGRISRMRLPLFVEATDCNERTTSPEEIGPILTADRRLEGPGVPLPCSAVRCPDDPGCGRAMREAQNIRNEFSFLCSQYRHDRGHALWMFVLAASYTVLAFGLMFAASLVASIPFIGAFAAAALAIAALGALAAAGAYYREGLAAQRRAEEHWREIEQTQERFREAANHVMEECCPHCIIIDLSLPTCER